MSFELAMSRVPVTALMVFDTIDLKQKGLFVGNSDRHRKISRYTLQTTVTNKAFKATLSSFKRVVVKRRIYRPNLTHLTEFQPCLPN